jgi:hypothetical protein
MMTFFENEAFGCFSLSLSDVSWHAHHFKEHERYPPPQNSDPSSRERPVIVINSFSVPDSIKFCIFVHITIKRSTWIVSSFDKESIDALNNDACRLARHATA